MQPLIEPHGGSLSQLLASPLRADHLRDESIKFPSIFLNDRQLCDVELLLSGAFSPLKGFLNQGDYDSVLERMRLSSGFLWPIPITLDLTQEDTQRIGNCDQIALRDVTGILIAILNRGDLWRPDKQKEAVEVFGTDSCEHPAVDYLMRRAGSYYLGGHLEGIQMPPHYDFHSLRHSPRQLRTEFESHGCSRIVAFQTRNPMHRAHKELTDRAARDVGGHLLIHPVVGLTKPGDIDHFTRVRSYKKLLQYYPKGKVFLSLLQLAMRMAGPREALLHAIIRKNYGCTHLIIGRDHAGPGNRSNGEPFYGPYQAQDLLKSHTKELGIEVVPFRLMVYAPESNAYKAIDEVRKDETTLSISGTQLRTMLLNGDEIPEWFSYREIIEELQQTYPPKSHKGFAVFLTGLSGSGKSTIANALQSRLLETLSCPVTLLDGDVVRTNLSKGLGFSKEDRSTNVQRIGYVASEIVKHRGVVICAPIAPYQEDRTINRQRIEREGGYIEVFANASLEVCERRDVKGLYAKARAGLIKGFTGIDDPYEVPDDPEVICNTELETVEESIGLVMTKLRELAFFVQPEIDE
ncbi:MAG: bifunctional sulfate adenylyltransferase/adenylylsulfate kinase [Bacteroidetes bacterium]|nr:bifunctional sulfate adenylyltransferase/adenylylsulfate kinase [Bacteroidota bacterium]